jgi:hypothetical protein
MSEAKASGDTFKAITDQQFFITNERFRSTEAAAETLNRLLLYRKAVNGDPARQANVQAVIDNELSYTEAAIRALRENPALRERFALDGNSVELLAGLLRMRNAERLTNGILDSYTPTNPRGGAASSGGSGGSSLT